jgi:dihydrolipoamide dehydrogenase
MPSKTLLRPGAALEAARAVPGAAGAVEGGVDVAATLGWRDQIVHEWSDDGQVAWLEGADIDLVRGHGRLDGERTVRVSAPDGSERVLRARYAVAVCTGSAALLPDIPGLAGAAPWTSREATAVQEVPDSLAILGGGVVACELATVFASFGTRVTMIARSSLLGGVEAFASDAVTAALRDAGVDVRCAPRRPRCAARKDGVVCPRRGRRRGARGGTARRDGPRSAHRRRRPRCRRPARRAVARRRRHDARARQ